MPSEKWNVEISGHILPNFDPSEVVNNFSSKIGVGQPQAKSMLNGRAKVIKRSVDHSSAQKYQAILSSIGVETKLIKIEADALGNLSILPTEEEKEIARQPFQENHQTNPPSRAAAPVGRPSLKNQVKTDKRKTKKKAAISIKQIEQAFRGELPTNSLGLGYRIALFSCALALLVIPLSYCALTLATGYLTYLFATTQVDYLIKAPVLVNGGLYIGTTFAGSVLFIFLLRPFLPSVKTQGEELILNPSNEKVFVELVHRVCDAVSAPYPKEIRISTDVNASASFQSGLLNHLQHNLVLVIGTPLLAGLSVNQLAGILAHEFGHFNQRSAMRSQQLIWTINNWLYTAANNQDGWNDALGSISTRSNNPIISLAVIMAKMMITITGFVLYVFMYLAVGLSCWLSRQMEFDADSYQISLSGSREFKTTFSQLIKCDYAMQRTFEGCFGSDQPGLPNNLTPLFSQYLHNTPKDIEKSISDSLSSGKSSWWDTHPSNHERIEKANTSSVKGIFSCNFPASMLFRDLEGLGKSTTALFYRERGYYPDKNELYDTNELIEQAKGECQAEDALLSYFNGWFEPDWTMGSFPKLDQEANSLDESVKQITELIGKIRYASPDVTTLKNNKDATNKKWLQAQLLAPRLKAGIAINRSETPLTGEEIANIDDHLNSINAQLIKLENKLRAHQSLMAQRISLAISLTKNVNQKNQGERLTLALESIQTNLSQLKKASWKVSVLNELYGRMNYDAEADYSASIMDLSVELYELMGKVLDSLGRVPCVVDANHKTLKEFLIAKNPSLQSGAANNPLDRSYAFMDLYEGLANLNTLHCSQVAVIAGAAEQAHNIEPIKIKLNTAK